MFIVYRNVRRKVFTTIVLINQSMVEFPTYRKQ